MFLVTGIVLLVGSWTPVGDRAVVELVIRHIGRHVPLSGAYSAQRGYDHPLPWFYAVQWLPYRVFGDRSSAGLAAMVWWNGAGLAGLVWLLVRRKAAGLAALTVTAMAVFAAQFTRGAFVLPWNPNFGLVSALLLIFAGWRAMVGERWLLPAVVALAMWSTGAHLGYAPFSLAVGVVAIVGLVVTTVRRDGRAGLTTLVRPALAALAVLVVLGAPMLVDLAVHGGDSNPAKIVELGRPAPGGPSVPAAQAVKVLRAELAIPPAWASTKVPYDFFLNVAAPKAPLLLLVVVAVALAAWRRQAADELAGIALALVATVAATAGLVNVADRVLQPWYLYPAHMASIALVSFLLWSAGRSTLALIDSRWPQGSGAHRGRALARRIAAPVAVLASSLLLVPSLRVPQSLHDVTEPIPALSHQVANHFRPGAHLLVKGPVTVDGYYTQALALQLDRLGFDVRVPRDQRYLYSPALVAPRRWHGTTLLIQLSKGRPTPPKSGARLLARTNVGRPEVLLVPIQYVSVWQQPSGRDQ